MRKEFSEWITSTFAPNRENIFLTGDLGYNALEGVAHAMGARFINAGVAEQNMISVAAGLASQGLTPICYSIAPFAVFRPAEQIRLDVCIHKLNVKIVGNGGGYGYGIMGASHHAIEDVGVLSTFPGMTCFIPISNEDVSGTCSAMLARKNPSYLRLGFGTLPTGVRLPSFAPIRKLNGGGKITVVGMGPVLLNALNACLKNNIDADIFAVSELPLTKLSSELIESLKKTERLFVVEEHVARGGLGEHLSRHILSENLQVKFQHRFALGYPDQRYGSQKYHCQQSGLDEETLHKALRDFAD